MHYYEICVLQTVPLKNVIDIMYNKANDDDDEGDSGDQKGNDVCSLLCFSRVSS